MLYGKFAFTIWQNSHVALTIGLPYMNRNATCDASEENGPKTMPNYCVSSTLKLHSQATHQQLECLTTL